MRILHYTLRMENPTDKQEPSVGTPTPPPDPEEAAAAAGQAPDEAGKADDEDRGDTLAAWIQRAKRAHELVDAVDLSKVADHDPEEVSKVGDVADALGELESGHAVEHVDGVDEITPEIDATHQKLEALFELLSGAGSLLSVFLGGRKKSRSLAGKLGGIGRRDR